MDKFKKLFPNMCSVIGMVHLRPLPGSPLYKGSIKEIITQACLETEIYLRNNIHGILVENMFDLPYLHHKYITAETTSTMTRVCTEIRKLVPANVPCGLQILAGANKEALAVAYASEFQFIRAESYIFGHIADEGYMDGTAGTLLRYRKSIDAEDVLIFCDIKKKHSSHEITKDISLEETAKAAEFFLSDGLILTGKSTGDPAHAQDIEIVKSSCKLPVIIGSGVSLENVSKYLNADGLIVGSYFKKTGHWSSELSDDNIAKFMSKIQKLQK